ncbi:MAG: HAMP domain-containing histidine kinase [Candidatus Dormibacteraeota bacterium]|nr:HAMP domain-containing histidine kinase [Candidatus Dormibacteraeota bacterium]
MEIQDGLGRTTVRGAGACSHPGAAALIPRLVEEFNAAPDTQTLVTRLLQHAVTETRSDRGVVSWIDGNEMIVAGCHDPFGEPVATGSRWPLAGEQVSAVALAEGRPEAGTLDESVMDMPEVSGALGQTYAGIKHLLVAPVAVAGEYTAILCVSRRRAETFSAEDGEALDLIAQAAAQPLRAARLSDLLDAALAELDEQLSGLESVERVKTDVLRLASHELRSPLTVLNGYISLIRGGFFGDLPAPIDEVMKILERRTGEMNGLVNDMLVAARVEDGAAAAKPQTVDVRSLVREAADSVALRASAQHRLRVELPDEPLFAEVDPERVVLALRNIIDNAVKYSPGGGEVVCQVADVGQVASVRVADHGLGIAPEDRDKLFTRFGRVVTSANSHIPGIGLGLYFTREVARRHGGDVALVAGEGPGSVFELTLPLVQ